MALSKKIRFEVFKRDRFTCQYCGKSAPDVVLNVDHIQPKSKGGTDQILNLLTSCFDCNQGKSARLIDDNAVVARQKAQLDRLEERRLQIEMMLDWQKGLLSLEEEIVDRLVRFWDRGIVPFRLTEHGVGKVRALIKRFGAEEVVPAMGEAASNHFFYESGVLTQESMDEAFNKISMYCLLARKAKEQPHIRQMYYIRGILRNRLNYVNEHELMDLMQYGLNAGLRIDWLTWLAKQVTSWTKFKTGIFDAAEAAKQSEG